MRLPWVLLPISAVLLTGLGVVRLVTNDIGTESVESPSPAYNETCVDPLLLIGGSGRAAGYETLAVADPLSLCHVSVVLGVAPSVESILELRTATASTVWAGSASVSVEVEATLLRSAGLAFVATLCNAAFLLAYYRTPRVAWQAVFIPIVASSAAWLVLGLGRDMYALTITGLFVSFGSGADDVCAMHSVPSVARRSVVVTTVVSAAAMVGTAMTSTLAIRQLAFFILISLALTCILSILSAPDEPRFVPPFRPRPLSFRSSVASCAIALFVSFACLLRVGNLTPNGPLFRYSIFDSDTDVMRAAACRADLFPVFVRAPETELQLMADALDGVGAMHSLFASHGSGEGSGEYPCPCAEPHRAACTFERGGDTRVAYLPLRSTSRLDSILRTSAPVESACASTGSTCHFPSASAARHALEMFDVARVGILLAVVCMLIAFVWLGGSVAHSLLLAICAAAHVCVVVAVQSLFFGPSVGLVDIVASMLILGTCVDPATHVWHDAKLWHAAVPACVTTVITSLALLLSFFHPMQKVGAYQLLNSILSLGFAYCVLKTKGAEQRHGVSGMQLIG